MRLIKIVVHMITKTGVINLTVHVQMDIILMKLVIVKKFVLQLVKEIFKMHAVVVLVERTIIWVIVLRFAKISIRSKIQKPVPVKMAIHTMQRVFVCHLQDHI